MHSIALAAREGYAVDSSALAKALAWLRSTLYEQNAQWAYPYSVSEEYAARAYALYALALHGQKEAGALSNLFLRRDQLPLSGKAHLLKAAKLMDADPLVLDTLAGELLNAGMHTATTLHFSDKEDMPWIHGSSARATSLILQALLETRKGFAGDEKVVRWLMEERKVQGRWRTTQENSSALYALQDYYRRYEKAAPSFEASVRVAADEWREACRGRSLETRRKRFALPSLARGGKGGNLSISLSKTGEGRLYRVLRLDYRRRPNARARGLFDPKDGGTLTPGSVIAPPARGDHARVKTPQDRTFRRAGGPLACGFRDRRPQLRGREPRGRAVPGGTLQRPPVLGSFHRSEGYDDRILIFADYLTAGEHEYSYLVQATSPGRYRMPPARVEQMYQPEVFATTEPGETVIGR